MTSKKILGDAGEHYALSQLSFSGMSAVKMPDNWKAYDLAVETGDGLVRVSVKTRSETSRWKAGSWFNFDDRLECDWVIFVFKTKEGPLRSWVIPYDVALDNANRVTERNKAPWDRYVSWAKLNRQPLDQYEDNWRMELSVSQSE